MPALRRKAAPVAASDHGMAPVTFYARRTGTVRKPRRATRAPQNKPERQPHPADHAAANLTTRATTRAAEHALGRKATAGSRQRSSLGGPWDPRIPRPGGPWGTNLGRNLVTRDPPFSRLSRQNAELGPLVTRIHAKMVPGDPGSSATWSPGDHLHGCPWTGGPQGTRICA